MKKITCDICKKIIGQNVGVGAFSMVTMAQYPPRSFTCDDLFVLEEKTDVDICIECSNKICEAQNKVVKEIRESLSA